jgi:hypothetical protein
MLSTIIDDCGCVYPLFIDSKKGKGDRRICNLESPSRK